MPKKIIFSKEIIIKKSFEIFKAEGIDAVTARAVAKALNASPAPIYKSIGNMDLLKEELIDVVKKLFVKYITEERTGIKFLDIGMGLAIFAREERELFTNLFLKENLVRDLFNEFLEIVHLEINKDTRLETLTEDKRNELLMDCWFFAYGLSSSIAIGFIKNPTDEYIKNKLLENPAKLLYATLEKNNENLKAF